MTAIFTAQTLIQVLMIVTGFYMVAAGSLTTGGLIASTMLAGRAMQPLGQVASLVARLHQTRIAFRLLDAIVKAPQEREDGAELIAPGEKVAIVGGIGSGKTSLLKLINGLVAPTTGRVMIDGMPVGHIEPALLRAGVGFAMQDAEVFQGTLRDNITMGDASLPDSLVLKAARTSLGMSWIARLPKGLDTPVRERGAGLSAGQKQSLTLARALAREPAILLLDEPSSAMDPASELQLIERLRAEIGARTLLVVTHRPAMLELVDRIVVLDGGLKVLDGPKAPVLASLRARAAQVASTVAATPRANA
jgi:ATP-binding cassette subfamily C protein LapB